MAVSDLIAFGAGFGARGALGNARLPQVSLARDEAQSFKLHVKVLSASVPGLGGSGLSLKRERPRVGVKLGSVQKQTELGVQVGGASSSWMWPTATAATSKADCNERKARVNGGDSGDKASQWRFGDTLMFVANVDDLVGPGIQLSLETESDVRIGPIKVTYADLRAVGTCKVDLRHQVLKQCKPRSDTSIAAGPASASAELQDSLAWESVPQTLDLWSASSPGLPSGKLLVSFGVSSDPSVLARSASRVEKGVLARVGSPISRWFGNVRKVLLDPLAACGMDGATTMSRSFSRELSRKFSFSRSKSNCSSVPQGARSPALQPNDPFWYPQS